VETAPRGFRSTQCSSTGRTGSSPADRSADLLCRRRSQSSDFVVSRLYPSHHHCELPQSQRLTSFDRDELDSSDALIVKLQRHRVRRRVRCLQVESIVRWCFRRFLACLCFVTWNSHLPQFHCWSTDGWLRTPVSIVYSSADEMLLSHVEVL